MISSELLGVALAIRERENKNNAYKDCLKICNQVVKNAGLAVGWTECGTEIFKRIQKLIGEDNGTNNTLS